MRERLNELTKIAEQTLDAVFENSRNLDPTLTRENIYGQGYCFSFAQVFAERTKALIIESYCGDHGFALTEEGYIVDGTALQFNPKFEDQHPAEPVLDWPDHKPKLLIAKAGIQTRLALKRMGIEPQWHYTWDLNKAAQIEPEYRTRTEAPAWHHLAPKAIGSISPIN